MQIRTSHRFGLETSKRKAWLAWDQTLVAGSADADIDYTDTLDYGNSHGTGYQCSQRLHLLICDLLQEVWSQASQALRLLVSCLNRWLILICMSDFSWHNFCKLQQLVSVRCRRSV